MMERQRILRVLGVTFLCLSALCGDVHAALNPTDQGVLNQLGSAWGMNALRWGNGDPCQWQGVICDSTGTTVVSLLLQAGSITGTIPAAIGSFTGLQQLDLSFNTGLVGSIPSEIGQLTSLTSLIIQACSLSGPIPSTIGNLKKLTFIGLNNNFLTGSIPSSLGSLPLLYWFDLSTNNLTGSLPVSTTSPDGYGLDTLANCMHFHFNNNSLSGGIPNELGAPSGGPTKLTKLIHLLLENNQFTGGIPDSVANLSALEILSLSNNKFTGPVPASLSTMTNASGSSTLQQILVRGNQLTGTIPNLAPLISKLTVVDFSNNLFDPQPFPAWIVNATNLQTVYLENSNLTGGFPSQILSSPQLETLWARSNALNGTLTIPAVVGESLQTVSVPDNLFVQIIQTDINVNMTQVDLQVSGNPVCQAGNIARPSTLCDKALGGKQAWASPYSPATNCPTQTCNDNLVINPFLVGNCNCTQPLEIQLEARRPAFSAITDELMETLRGQLAQQLNLRMTQVWITTAAFTADGRAEINVDFFAADGVSTLDGATTLNVTHSLTSNYLALPAVKPYLARVLVDGATFLAANKKSLSAGAIAGIVLGIVAALTAIGIYAFWQKRRAERLKHIAQPFAKWGGGEGEKGVAAPMVAGARFFMFSEIKRITNNFENEIGVGGYGKVYSGVLDNGTQVAVKRAQEGSMQGAEEFKNEIELLSRVHHKNLLGLVGYCYEHGEQMLVYEFMVNGTVTEWLRGKKPYLLDWTKRLSIAVGSARGLTYLHELANPPIIHRDIKSQNILLDDKHIAKVADFGLSKLAPEGEDQVITDQVKGTLGYLDPEYYMTQHLSDKSDVYSFGVVLLELATSRAPIQGGKYIVREVRAALQEGGTALEELLDPSCYEASQEDLDRFIDLALNCVEEKGADRPTMNEVVKELEVLALHNKPKAKASAQATDPSWLVDVYGDDDYNSAEHGASTSTSKFNYSGGYSPGHPEPK